MLRRCRSPSRRRRWKKRGTDLTVLNSVIFHTENLKEVREFYSKVLGLAVGTFEKDGRTVPDENDTYVNFDLNGTLLCFEVEEGRLDQGALVLKVESLEKMKDRLRAAGVPLGRNTTHFLMIEDPEGREVILEET